MAITHANTSNDTKIPTFLEKKLGNDVILVQCPFNVLKHRPSRLGVWLKLLEK